MTIKTTRIIFMVVETTIVTTPERPRARPVITVEGEVLVDELPPSCPSIRAARNVIPFAARKAG